MNPWFTIEKIDSATYAISEYAHWEEPHCYLLLGDEKALLIDSGLGVGNIGAVVRELTALPVEAVSTHVHWDHIGGHRHFEHISVHEAEKEWLTGGFPLPLEAVKRNLLLKPCCFPDVFDADAYQVYQGTPSRILHDGDVFDLGHRTLRVIHTPGHSPGHMCFYELERQYLYTGDLIYEGTLFAFYPSANPEAFMKSGNKALALPAIKLLPGHHALNIPLSLAADVYSGFESLLHAGNLHQESGVFTFHGFAIHI